MIEQSGGLAERWMQLETQLVERFGKRPDLNAILFLVGIQESGQTKSTFTKEEKQDLMHVAVCHLLSSSGYYALDAIDKDGWPHYIQLKALPNFGLLEQENFIKDHVLLYFDQHPSDHA